MNSKQSNEVTNILEPNNLLLIMLYSDLYLFLLNGPVTGLETISNVHNQS